MFKTYREEKERKRENDRIARDNLYLRCTEIEPFQSSVGKQHITIEKEFDIPDRIKWAAYDIITRAPSVKVTYHHDLEEYRQNTTPPGYKKAQLIRRVIQTILFIILLLGIYPWHYNRDYLMSRCLILLTCMAYTIITAWIHIEKTSAKLYEQNIRLLNKLITTDDIAAYMRTLECYQFISDIAESPHTPAIDRHYLNKYIFWYLHRPTS